MAVTFEKCTFSFLPLESRLRNDSCLCVYSFTFTHSAHERTIRIQCSNTLIVPLWNITAGKRTFQYRAATLWNRLPFDVRSKLINMSLNEFTNEVLYKCFSFYLLAGVLFLVYHLITVNILYNLLHTIHVHLKIWTPWETSTMN